MGCTSSKGNTNSPTTVSDNDQQLINDQFRNWLKSNRPKADEYVLNDVISTAPQANDIDDYRTIVSKALDLLSDRHDIKSANKLGKLVQKEISLASPKKVAHTIDILKQTAEKLHHGQIILDSNQQQTITTNGEATDEKKVLKNQDGQIVSGEHGIALKEALETARVLFYKGKQAAIFANPSGGYTVRVLDESDDALKEDGNLLRSIIVTEVKMRPKPATAPPTTSPPLPAADALPPLPPSKVPNENEICDDFRRSIDAALKGLEAIYQTSPTTSTENTQDIHHDKASTSNRTNLTSEDQSSNLPETVHQSNLIKNTNDEEQQKDISQIDIQPKLVNAIDDMNEIMLDIIETTTEGEIGDTKPSTDFNTAEDLTNVEQIVKEVKEHGEIHESKENLPIKETSTNAVGPTSSSQNEEPTLSSPPLSREQEVKPTDDDRLKSMNSDQDKFNKQTSLDDSARSPKLDTLASSDDIAKESIINNESTSSNVPRSINQTVDDENKISLLASSPSVDMNTNVKSPTHNVTYTEIIHSESRDGEQSRRLVTESYDEYPSKKDDEATTSHKVVTKSEFSNDPALGEKTMEQSVQVITVKVRNETITTRSPSQTSDNDVAHDKQSIKNDANTNDTTI